MEFRFHNRKLFMALSFAWEKCWIYWVISSAWSWDEKPFLLCSDSRWNCHLHNIQNETKWYRFSSKGQVWVVKWQHFGWLGSTANIAYTTREFVGSFQDLSLILPNWKQVINKSSGNHALNIYISWLEF